jgi:hypothetical protein
VWTHASINIDLVEIEVQSVEADAIDWSSLFSSSLALGKNAAYKAQLSTEAKQGKGSDLPMNFKRSAFI